MSRQQDIFSVLRLNNFSSLKQFLSLNPNTPFTDVVDKNSATVLHLACNNDNKDIVELLLGEYDRRAKLQPEQYNTERKRYWINLKDGEGFACLHYAVFKANFAIARILEDNGADIYLVNSLGLCVMHIAAQGDSPLLINYYMSKGFKIQVEDNKGSTPMHWACYSGRENAVNALLSWGAQLDCQDKIYGLTPLHLAVLSGNGKIVKKLLIRGANRHLKDFRNKLPLDIARDNQYPNITNMIEDKFGCSQFYNLKQPFRKTSKLSIPFVVFMFLYFTNFGLNVARIILSEKVSFALNMVYIGLTIIPICFVALAGCTDPGYLKNRSSSPAQLFKILSKYQPSNICFDCQVIKPPRSRHCEVCKSCVMVYDHHCPWINNCVGAKNYIWFYLFILTMEADMVFTLAYQIYILSAIDWGDCKRPLCILEVISVIYSLLNCLFCIPLMILIYVQTQNCIRNETTLERYGSVADRTVSSASKGQSLVQSRANSSASLVDDREGQIARTMTERTEFQSSQARDSKSLEQPLVSRPSKVFQNSPWSNCMAMCFRNKTNIVYRVGA